MVNAVFFLDLSEMFRLDMVRWSFISVKERGGEEEEEEEEGRNLQDGMNTFPCTVSSSRRGAGVDDAEPMSFFLFNCRLRVRLFEVFFFRLFFLLLLLFSFALQFLNSSFFPMCKCLNLFYSVLSSFSFLSLSLSFSFLLTQTHRHTHT